MAQEVLSWVVAIPLLGFVTGLRSMTPMAVLSWFAFLGRVPEVDDTWAWWVGKLPLAILLTVLAIAEYVADKLPQIGNRTAPAPLVWRLALGGLIGAIVAIALDGSSLEAGLLAVLCALAGTFLGFHIRKEIVERVDCADWQAAGAEDVIAVTCSVIAMGIITA
jgi:uncharacterized membrane protein